ncbi:DNA-binding MarR family transcriptional regulator [Haloactinospora alba]|uniref:DNA-binding MarR family transcriptional regulator n=1 Tax=Haloactinospora alba TaxID=405555 RepID=A0A543NID8_9ACTN|nr:MarR family transcriptional regulator [Haloactinospora alba]TQN31605.1 DNA-binding MarR family transcriptional regulator [Haloactinospora alba]
MTLQPHGLTSELYSVLRGLVLVMRQAAADQRVSSQHLAILGSLESGNRRVTALAEEHGVRTPTMTAHISKLEEMGAVRRDSDAGDARVVVVELSEYGRQLLSEGKSARMADLEARLQQLSAAEREAVEAALPALAKLSGRRH